MNQTMKYHTLNQPHFLDKDRDKKATRASPMAKDMYNDKHTASAFLTFEQHQPDGWSTEIIQPSRSLSACLLTLLNQSAASDQVN